MLSRLTICVLLTFGMIACGPATDAFDQLIEDYGDTLEKIKLADQQHATDIEDSTDLEEVEAEEELYYAEMTLLMEDMMGTSDMLEQCGDMPNMGFAEMMSSMDQEVEAHYATMMEADTHEDALDEESRHQTEMSSQYEEMGSVNDEMMGMMGMDMGCPSGMGSGSDSGDMSDGSGM